MARKVRFLAIIIIFTQKSKPIALLSLPLAGVRISRFPLSYPWQVVRT